MDKFTVVEEDKGTDEKHSEDTDDTKDKRDDGDNDQLPPPSSGLCLSAVWEASSFHEELLLNPHGVRTVTTSGGVHGGLGGQPGLHVVVVAVGKVVIVEATAAGLSPTLSRWLFRSQKVVNITGVL